MPTEKEKKAADAALKAAASKGTVNNCVWSNNNAACANTWFCLKDILGQLDADFDPAATIKMSKLAFWNSVAEQNREIDAASIADQLTKMFINFWAATYEDGQNYA